MARAPSGKTKLRLPEVAERDERAGRPALVEHEGHAGHQADATNRARVFGAPNPHEGATLSAEQTEGDRAPTGWPSPSSRAPATGSAVPGSGGVGRRLVAAGRSGPGVAAVAAARSWAGSTITASTAAMAIRGSSPQNRARQP